jgi:hypothetical protein
MRHLAVRLVVSSICLHLLFALPLLSAQGVSRAEQIEDCQENINSLATNICFSVPFFNANVIHHNPESATFRINGNLTSPEILPRIATLLSWPLSVAVSTDVVPVAQKEWLKRKLKVVAGVQFIAKTEEFKF